MKKMLPVILLLVSSSLASQQFPPLAYSSFDETLHPDQQIKLFDVNEIRKRKIDTVYWIHHPGSWTEGDSPGKPCDCSYNDTLIRFIFDKEGKLKEYTQYDLLGTYATTFFYNTSGNRTAFGKMTRENGVVTSSSVHPTAPPDTSAYKKEVIRERKSKDSLITNITFLKFKGRLDTATIITERFNTEQKLISKRGTVNQRSAREYGDDTGESTYYYEYDYDDKGRLIYYRDFNTREYLKISYPLYGRLTEIYDTATNMLTDWRIRTVTETDKQITITTRRSMTTLNKLEKDSKLISLITSLSTDEVPIITYNEIVYKSRD